MKRIIEALKKNPKLSAQFVYDLQNDFKLYQDINNIQAHCYEH